MWFSHPKPFITKAVAMQMAEQNKLPPPDTTTITVEHEDVSIPELSQQADVDAHPLPLLSVDQRGRFRAMIRR